MSTGYFDDWIVVLFAPLLFSIHDRPCGHGNIGDIDMYEDV